MTREEVAITARMVAVVDNLKAREGMRYDSQVAKSAKIHNIYFTRWRKGQAVPLVRDIYRLCERFNISADFIITGYGNEVRTKVNTDSWHIKQIHREVQQIQSILVSKAPMVGFVSKAKAGTGRVRKAVY